MQIRNGGSVTLRGLHFKDTAATKADPRIAEIAEIENAAERALTLFAYLEDWVPPGQKTKSAGSSANTITPKRLASAEKTLLALESKLAEANKNIADMLEITKGAANANFERMRAENATLLGHEQEKIDELGAAILKLQNAAARYKQQLEVTVTTISTRIDAAVEAVRGERAVAAPVALWTEKQAEHKKAQRNALWWFSGSLFALAAAAGGGIYFLATHADLINAIFAPSGCSKTIPRSCTGISTRGLLISGAILTIFTVLFWFARLQMKLFLAERHLVLDARERRAFAQTYVGLLSEADTSKEASQQRSLVYAALFRPSSDGTVKEDGGLDPSIAAAVSKLLSK